MRVLRAFGGRRALLDPFQAIDAYRGTTSTRADRSTTRCAITQAEIDESRAELEAIAAADPAP